MSQKPLASPLETDFSYPFDFSLYDIDEIDDLIKIVNTLETLKDHIDQNVKLIIDLHQKYRIILSNQTEEKRLDVIFKKELGFSIFEMFKEANKSLK